ncbi:UNVERIFIED_CONTAM: hypothetical protein Sangu_2642500 [Sesamum angustifolium]|uniref:Uncharacterized protein n=1 Tax=Sesamum angustifolium TaxID=2727405 RepID=A0AAW2J3G0_9LAMI
MEAANGGDLRSRERRWRGGRGDGEKPLLESYLPLRRCCCRHHRHSSLQTALVAMVSGGFGFGLGLDFGENGDREW